MLTFFKKNSPFSTPEERDAHSIIDTIRKSYASKFEDEDTRRTLKTLPIHDEKIIVSNIAEALSIFNFKNEIGEYVLSEEDRKSLKITDFCDLIESLGNEAENTVVYKKYDEFCYFNNREETRTENPSGRFGVQINRHRYRGEEHSSIKSLSFPSLFYSPVHLKLLAFRTAFYSMKTYFLELEKKDEFIKFSLETLDFLYKYYKEKEQPHTFNYKMYYFLKKYLKTVFKFSIEDDSLKPLLMKLIDVLTVFKYESEHSDAIDRLKRQFIEFCLENELPETYIALESFISSSLSPLKKPEEFFALALRARLTLEECESLFKNYLDNSQLLLAMAEHIFISNEGKEKNILTMNYLKKIHSLKLDENHILSYRLLKTRCFDSLFNSDFIETGISIHSYGLTYSKSDNDKGFILFNIRLFPLYETFMIEYGLHSDSNEIKDIARKLDNMMDENRSSIHLKSAILHGLDDIKDYLSSNGFCRNPSIPSIKLYTQYVTQAFLNDLACLVKNNSDLDIPTQNRIHSIKKHILKKQLNTFKEKDYSYRLKLDCLQLLKDIFELADKTGIFLTEASSAGIKERFDLQNEKIELYHFMPEIAQSIGNNFIFPLELLEPEYIENLDKVFNSSDSRKSLFSYHHSEYIYEKRNSQISELGDNKSNIEIVSASPQNH